MTDLIVQQIGKAGHITLNRPQALNALTWDMCLAIEATLEKWRDDDSVGLVMIDGAGDRAFCSGGDIADMYASGQNGDLDYGRRFWRDEYRLNSKIAHYPKPIVTFLHGFTMGGGVGIGCHASHRIVCENSQVALPECAIGLVPDVGGSYLLARAPGLTGTYLGLTGARMDAGDAIYAQFADHFVPQAQWPALCNALATHGIAAIPDHPAPDAQLEALQNDIAASYCGSTLADILGNPQTGLHKAVHRNAPLAMACAMVLIDNARQHQDLNTALAQEFRFTARAVAQSDFIEGIRAAIIDKDRNPKWQTITDAKVATMLAPLGDDIGALEKEN